MQRSPQPIAFSLKSRVGRPIRPVESQHNLTIETFVVRPHQSLQPGLRHKPLACLVMHNRKRCVAPIRIGHRVRREVPRHHVFPPWLQNIVD